MNLGSGQADLTGSELPKANDALAQSLSPILKTLLHHRNLRSPQEISAFLFPNLNDLTDPFQMKGMRESVARIEKAIERSEKIMIHGDYDVDGITGAAVLAKTLMMMGAHVRTFLPDRAEDGYGVSARAIQDAAKDGLQLLITVDCGITAASQIKLARELGMEVIVIDHHQIPAEGVPPADIILNPFQADCPYPFKGLSAAGLAFKLAQALIGTQAYHLLDLAALSTVCDVAPLKDENRIIVRYGLQALTKRTNLGVKALSQVSKLSGAINVGHVGFVFGPKINAAGRMSSPEIALQLLVTKNEKEAMSLAQILDEENRVRQKEERQQVKEAILEVERVVNFSRDRVIVVARQGWHPGVIGIVASRLVDKYHRPAIVIALDGEKGKGSGRSIKHFPLHVALRACHEQLLEYGGHAQAAGLSIRENHVEAFRKTINQFAADFSPEVFAYNLEAELEIRFSDLTANLLRELDLLEPHGVENPRPLFMTRNVVLQRGPERLNPQTVKLVVKEGDRSCEALWTDRSGEMDTAILRQTSRFDLFYTVKLRNWQGMETLVLEVKKIKPQL